MYSIVNKEKYKFNVKKISWNDFEIMIDSMAQMIKTMYPNIKYVYGIPKGGLNIAVRLSHLLNIELILDMNDVIMIGKKKMLIVDDIVDSGSTMQRMHNNLHEQTNTAVLIKRNTSLFEPNIFIEEVKDEWIEFPWEAS